MQRSSLVSKEENLELASQPKPEEEDMEQSREIGAPNVDGQ